MDKDKKVIIVNKEDKNFYYITGVLSIIFIVFGVLAGAFSSPWGYLILILPAMLIGLSVWYRLSMKNRKEETEFNYLGIIKRINGEVKSVYCWECFNCAIIDQNIYDKINTNSSFLVKFSMQAINMQGYYTNEFVSFITNVDTLYKIQEVAPIVLFERKYLTPKHKNELAEIERNYIKYQNDPLQKISIRGRVAYLIRCLETAILHYGEATEADVKLVEFLWEYTSAFLDEEEMQGFKEAVAEFKEKNEVFPDYAPKNLENLTCLQFWFNEFNELYNFYKVEEDNEKSKLIYNVLTALKSVAWHTPQNEDYSFDTAMCYKTLDEIEGVNNLLVNGGIVLPEIKFLPELHSYAHFFLSFRTAEYGIGYAFNGAKTYSIILQNASEEDFEKETAQAFDEEVSTAEEQMVEPSPDDVYQILEQMVAPTVKKGFLNRKYWFISWQMPAYAIALLIIGVILTVASIGTFIAYIYLREEGLQLFTIVFAPFGGLMLNAYFSFKKREQQDRNYPLKILDLIFILALCGAHLYGVFYTFNNYGNNPVNPIYLIEFTLFASIYASQFITLLLTSQNKKINEDYYDVKHTEKKEAEIKVHHVNFEIAEIVVAFTLAIASLGCLIIFNSNHGVVEGVLCITFALTASVIINSTSMVAQGVRRSPKKQKTTAKLILFFMLALAIVSIFLTGSLVVNNPVDMFVPMWLVAIAIYRLVLLILSLVRYNKNTAI